MRPEAQESLDERERERLWRLYARHFDELKDFFERRDPSVDAHDLAFETLLRASKKNIEDIDHPERYLIGIARNVRMETFHKQRRLSRRTSLAHVDVDESPSPEELLMLEDLRALVAKAVKGLNPPERDLYERVMREQPSAEMAEELHISQAQLYVKISRVKQKLRKLVVEIEASSK